MRQISQQTLDHYLGVTPHPLQEQTLAPPCRLSLTLGTLICYQGYANEASNNLSGSRFADRGFGRRHRFRRWLQHSPYWLGAGGPGIVTTRIYGNPGQRANHGLWCG